MSHILVACEMSGRVRDAFLALGYDAWSCDILPTESPIPGRHYQEDILNLISRFKANRWGLMIAHPPCQYLSNSGASAVAKKTAQIQSAGRKCVRRRRSSINYSTPTFPESVLKIQFSTATHEN